MYRVSHADASSPIGTSRCLRPLPVQVRYPLSRFRSCCRRLDHLRHAQARSRRTARSTRGRAGRAAASCPARPSSRSTSSVDRNFGSVFQARGARTSAAGIVLRDGRRRPGSDRSRESRPRRARPISASGPRPSSAARTCSSARRSSDSTGRSSAGGRRGQAGTGRGRSSRRCSATAAVRRQDATDRRRRARSRAQSLADASIDSECRGD